MRVSHGLMPWLLCLGYFSHVSAIGRGADQTPMPKFMPRQHCPKTNVPLRNFLQKHIFEKKTPLLPDIAKTLEEFIVEVKLSLDAHQLPDRAIYHIFSEAAEFHPTCSGLWMEFGVFQGSTINHTANFREMHCGPACPSVHGFDTFTGLPEQWVKGLFSDSLPDFLHWHSTYAGDEIVVSYLHVDCDLYAGTKDIFKFLASKLVVGSVILFDELVNNEDFRDHEIKAFFEFLRETGTKVLPIGIKGPLPFRNDAVDLEIKGLTDSDHQSAAFVVAEMSPNSHPNINCKRRRSRACHH